MIFRKKISLILIIGLILLSCNSKFEIELYKSNAQQQFDIIMGYKLHKFFSKNKNVSKYNLEISKSTLSKLFKIKDSIIRAGNKLEIDSSYIGGIWDYAIVFSKDTIYSSKDFYSWRYKDKVLPLPNLITEEELFSHTSN